MKIKAFVVGLILPLLLSVGVAFNARSEVATVSSQEPERVLIKAEWKMQDAAKVAASGPQISQSDFSTKNWYTAVVPGTVLTTLVENKVYPEPLFGENNRPDRIPESLCRTSYWYRSTFEVPLTYKSKQIWLNFDGVNYSADVWINGKQVGGIKGAFSRGTFDVTSFVDAGEKATLAVLVHPQPHPGRPHEHTIAAGVGSNGGVTAIDGATFLCSIGWDWIPAIRDRNTGIWQQVYLSASGPVTLLDPLITTKLPLPHTDSADISVLVTLQNISDRVQKGVLSGSYRYGTFERTVEIPAKSVKEILVDPSSSKALHVNNPDLWWPNGYGPQNLQNMDLAFSINGNISDRRSTTFGIREISYFVPWSKNLTISVNGVPIFCRGGNWGMDEAMKRIPRERLEAQIRMHKIANYTIIRNWVGQSTSQDFYDMCDKYGILVWDEFFQPNPGDGPNPIDIDSYIANVEEKVLRFRNHPSIALWCARNEGNPPQEIDERLAPLLAKLDPVRHYQRSSIEGPGVHSSGPYCWWTPREFYNYPAGDVFACEIGSMSIPTLESIQGMLPRKDWEEINDDWAEHDFAAGASGGEWYAKKMADRYGDVLNLADFARKGQLMNYEAFRSIYEGRNAKLFNPVTGVILWMSNPAQPSFVWQLYHHDLEPNSALYATKKACEPIHIQMNEKDEIFEVANALPRTLKNANIYTAIYNMDGTLAQERKYTADILPSKTTFVAKPDWPDHLSSVHFIKLILSDSAGKVVSENFYWRPLPERLNNLKDLETLPVVSVEASVRRSDNDGKCFLFVTLKNPTDHIALMAHLQLRRKNSNERILPVFYSDNYVSLTPKESKTIVIEAGLDDLRNQVPLIAVDGWNIDVKAASNKDYAVGPNTNTTVKNWPVTHLPTVAGTWVSTAPPADKFKINSGGQLDVGDFEADGYFSGGHDGPDRVVSVDVSAPNAGPEAIYKSERWGNSKYKFHVRPVGPGRAYTVRLHFSETTFDEVGKRKFNVVLNGAKILSNFDPFAEAGDKNKAVVRDFANVLPDSQGNIVLSFEKGAVDEAQINGIEILPWP